MTTFATPRSADMPVACCVPEKMSSLIGLQILKPGLAFMALEGRLC
jgi:hypothetical protein